MTDNYSEPERNGNRADYSISRTDPILDVTPFLTCLDKLPGCSGDKGVLAEPGGEFFFGEFAGGEGEIAGILFLLTNCEAGAVEIEKQFTSDGGGAFVAIEEGMVLGESEGVSGGEGTGVGWAIAVLPKLLRSRQCGEEDTFIPDAIHAAVLGKLSPLKHVDDFLLDPFRFAHSASFLSMFRFSRMMHSAMSI